MEYRIWKVGVFIENMTLVTVCDDVLDYRLRWVFLYDKGTNK